MRRFQTALLAGLVLSLALHVSARAADVPAGTYKVLLPAIQPDKSPLWLIKIEEKDGKVVGSVLGKADQVPPAKLEKLGVEEQVLRFDLNLQMGPTIHFEYPLPKQKGVPILGSMSVEDKAGPAILEPSQLTSLDPFAVGKEALARKDGGVEIVDTVLEVLSKSAENKVPAEQVKSWAERAITTAEPYGPLWHREVLLSVAEALKKEKAYAEIGLGYARQAEKLLKATDPPTLQKRTLTALEGALIATGKDEEAKAVRARNNKIFFFPVKAFAGRKGKSERVVLVELFTGAQCPPCVAADLAFDALATTYKPTEVVRLQYHLHIPGPDPLTNADTEARARFYKDAIEGTPTVLFNGKVGAEGGGPAAEAQTKYEEFKALIDPLLEKPDPVKLKASATRKDGKIRIKVDVSDLQKPGDDVKLRLVLVEEEVAYQGGNKLPTHHDVVRAFPGGAGGTALKEKTASKEFTVDVEEVRKQLTDYLDKAAARKPFPKPDRPLELKKLRVVAFVQDDESGEILQAVQVDVKE
jgi:hypothetical protein